MQLRRRTLYLTLLLLVYTTPTETKGHSSDAAKLSVAKAEAEEATTPSRSGFPPFESDPADDVTPRHATPRETTTRRRIQQSTEGRQRNEDSDYVCTLREEDILRYLDASSRTWLIQDEDFKALGRDLQSIINCTSPGDKVLFDVTEQIQPQRRVILPWKLTISSYVPLPDVTEGLFPEAARKTVFICPKENEGVFLVRSQDVLFANVEFTQCSLTAKRSRTAIIKVTECAVPSTNGTIQLHHVQLRRNQLRASVMISVSAASCSALEMIDVRFANNDCNGICGALMSAANTLRDITVQNNRNNINNDAPVMLRAPPGSRTEATRITAVDNKGTVLDVRIASLEIEDSLFFRNARGASFGDVPPRSVPFDSVPLSASINTFDASVRIVDCRFAENSGIYGQAVIAIQSNLTIHRSVLNENVGDYGGGAYFKSSNVVITSTNFSQNKAEKDGGAVRAVYSDVEISDAAFQDNTARFEGGAFYVLQSSLTCRRLTFVANLADEGGVFYFTSPSTFRITHANFSWNEAGTGGAIALNRNSSGIVQRSIFFRNWAEESGSVCHVEQESSLTMKRCNITQNHRTALYATDRSTLDIQHSNFTSNEDDGEAGGGIFCIFSSMLVMNHTSFTENKALSGGAFALSESSTGDIQNCQFALNSAKRQGGSAYLDESSKLTVNGSIFEKSDADAGGGIYLEKNSQVVVESSQFFDGSANAGAAISADHNGSVAIHRSLFEGNIATESGGVIDLYLSHCTMTHSVFRNNRAEEDGGAVHIMRSALMASHLSLHRNQAKGNGGAIFSRHADSIHIDQSNFSENQATEGGAVMLLDQPAGWITNSLFVRGKAESSQRSAGGAIRLLYGNLTIVHVEMMENSAARGGDVSAFGSILWVINSTSVHGAATQGGGSIEATHNSHIFLQNSSFHGASTDENGGAIMLDASSLKASEINITECTATLGGGMHAARSASVLCSNCIFERNRAEQQGGGVYLASQSTQFLAFQFENCDFCGNEANRGGGMHVLGEDRIANCTDPLANCTFVALQGTVFMKNTARTAGGAVLAGDLNMIHLNCTRTQRNGTLDFFRIDDEFQHMDVLNRFENICPDWVENKADTYGDVIGSYASRMRKWLQDGTTNSTVQIVGDQYRVQNHQSGALIPSIFMEMVDALDQGPVTGIGDKPIRAVMHSPGGLFTGELALLLEGGAGNFSGVAGYVRPGDYDVQIYFSQRSLPNITLTIEIRRCTIGESIAANGTYCQPCSGGTYNFYPEEASCIACPEHGMCDFVAIHPRAGYWHPMPCSTEIQECLTERACDSEGRGQELRTVDDGITDCDFNSTFIEDYQRAQCRKGYKGPLCGSCDNGYGRTQSLRCERCDMGWTNYLLVLVSIIIMLGLTYFTVRSSISSGHKLREKRRRPVIRLRTMKSSDGQPSTSGVASRSSDDQEITESPTPSASQATEDDIDEADRTKQVHRAREKELMQWKAAEILKITINYLQVISIAVSLNVKWTDSVASAFEVAEFLGGLTTEATVRSFDCLITEDAAIPRSVILTIVSLSMPVIVWLIYVVIWSVAMCSMANSFAYLLQRCALSLTVVSYVAYIGVTKTVVNILNCIEVHDSTVFSLDSTTRYWAVDTSQVCFAGTHAVLAGVAGFPILILFSFCFPAISAIVLLKHRSRKSLRNKWLFATVGFMYRAYNQKFIFWESIVMLRKAVLAIVVVFAYPLGGNLQGVMSSCVLIIALYFQAFCRPYRKEFEELNYYEGLSLLVSTLTFVAVVVVLFNVALLGFLLATFWRRFADVLRRILTRKEPGEAENHKLHRLLMMRARSHLSRVHSVLVGLTKNDSVKDDKEVELV